MAIASTTIAIAAVTVAVVAAGVGTYSAIQAAKAEEDANKFQKKLASTQAAQANLQAQAEADRIKRRNRIYRGRQDTIVSKSGVNLSGSALDVIFDSQVQGELDVLTALYTGKISQDVQLARAQQAGFAAETARTQGLLTASGTALSGAGSAVGASRGFVTTPQTTTTGPEF